MPHEEALDAGSGEYYGATGAAARGARRGAIRGVDDATPSPQDVVGGGVEVLDNPHHHVEQKTGKNLSKVPNLAHQMSKSEL
jgi:hypothetical protein